MKKRNWILSGSIISICLWTSSLLAHPFPISVQAESAIVIDAETGRVVYEKNASKKQYPASLTKVATALCILERKNLCLEDLIEASQEAVGSLSATQKAKNNYSFYPSYILEVGASHIGMKRGEILSLQDLLYGLMLVSGDDAANALAQHLGKGSIENFMQELNAFVQQLECRDTHFCNPHGLFHPDHMTTCQDMALLCRHAMKNDLFRKIVKTSRYERPKTNKQPKSLWMQTNKLLIPTGKLFYKYAVGIKTGYLAKAQHNLACAAEKDGRMFIAVYMHCPDRNRNFRDAIDVFEALFRRNSVEKIIVHEGEQSFIRVIEGPLWGVDIPVKIHTLSSVRVKHFSDEEPKLRCQLIWDPITIPCTQGARMGELIVSIDDRIIAREPLFASHDVLHHWLVHVVDYICEYPLIAAGILLLLVYGIYRLLNRSKRCR